MSEPGTLSEVVPVTPSALERARRWSGILAAFFSAQSGIQLLGVAAGLLFVNFLPVEEFAVYTLANSALIFFTFASDLGSTSSLVYFFRATAQEPEGFAPMLAAVQSLRRSGFVVGSVVTLAVLPLAARGRGLPLLDALLCTAGVLIAVWFQIQASLGVLTLRLHDRYGASYRAELSGGALRLLLAGLIVAMLPRQAWLAVVSGAAGTALIALLAYERTSHPALSQHDLAPQRRRVLRYLLPSLPSALYFSIQGPLIVWLSATFGSAQTIAEVGAIGRLGLMVGIFGSLTGVVFLPRLARIHDEKLYLQRFVQFGVFLAAIGAALYAFAALLPGPFLALLGPHYRGLHDELVLVVASAAVTLVGGYLVGVNLARSWNRWQTVAVAALIGVQATAIAVLPLGTTRGALQFGLISTIAGTLFQIVTSALGFTRPHWVRWMP